MGGHPADPRQEVSCTSFSAIFAREACRTSTFLDHPVKPDDDTLIRESYHIYHCPTRSGNPETKSLFKLLPSLRAERSNLALSHPHQDCFVAYAPRKDSGDTRISPVPQSWGTPPDPRQDVSCTSFSVVTFKPLIRQFFISLY